MNIPLIVISSCMSIFAINSLSQTHQISANADKNFAKISLNSESLISYKKEWKIWNDHGPIYKSFHTCPSWEK